MFSSPVYRRLLQECKPFLFPFLTQRFLSLNIARHRKPIERIPRRTDHRHRPRASVKKPIEKPQIYAQEKITKIFNVLKYSTWDSAQEQLENLPIKWDSFTVNQVLKAHPPMEKAWLFFNWVSDRRNLKHDQYTFTTMLDIFGEAGRISSMMYVFEQMKEKGIKIDVVTYTSLMHWVSNDGNIDGSIKLWKEMRAKGCRPTVVTYTAFMKILFDHRRVNEAAGVYEEMLESGLSPNCHTYTVLMDYLASSGKSSEALEIFKRMQDAGVQPDKATCNILVEIFCRTGEAWAIIKILEYMKENFLVLRYPIYLKTLEALKIAGQSDELLRQVNRHCSPEQSDANSAGDNLDLENSFVLHLLSKQNATAVDSLLSDMMDKGIRLESNVISEVIELNIARGRKKSALLAYTYGLKLGINIDRTAYLALLGSFIRANSFENVVEILESMFKQGLSLGTHLTSSLIHRLGCCRKPALAAKVFNILPEKERSTPEYTALMSAYFSSDNVDAGLETFKIMKSKGVPVTLGTYYVLLAGLEKGHKVRELNYYMKEKRMMQVERFSQNASMEERMCDLLFTGDYMLIHAR